MTNLRLDNIVKHYGPVEAVKGISFDCKEGEMVALLGPSGCGKSTTLKIVAGVEEPTSGSVCFDGNIINDLEPSARNIAMVFEDYALYPHLSVSQNIAFPLRARHFPKREIELRVNTALKLLGLEAHRNDNVQDLSGGAQQRVSIGRAIVRNPNVMIFDEPLSHLDSDQKVQLRLEIKRLQQEVGLTSILVTHDQTEAMALSDRVVVMNAGRVEQFADPETLYDNPSGLFVATFVGEPPMNLLPAILRSNGSRVFTEGDGWQLELDGELASRARRRLKNSEQRVVIGARPEHVSLVPDRTTTKANAVSGTVFFIEKRGDTDVILVHGDDKTAIEHPDATADAGTLLVDVPVPHTIRVGDRVQVNLPTSKIHLFEYQSGVNLRSIDD